ncbi:MAG: hypothetical protein MZW92_16780 [Comamonadaceae bacterium]|nr:hypothetical protein [Comamonadaceae bacterium]
MGSQSPIVSSYLMRKLNQSVPSILKPNVHRKRWMQSTCFQHANFLSTIMRFGILGALFGHNFPIYPSTPPFIRTSARKSHTADSEYYPPLFVERTETLFDYLPTRITLVLHQTVDVAATAFFEEAASRHEQRKGNLDRPPLPTELLYLDPAELRRHFQAYPRIRIPGITHDDGTATSTVAFACEPLADITSTPRKSRQPRHSPIFSPILAARRSSWRKLQATVKRFWKAFPDRISNRA